jgi:hypothetical protein
MGLAIQEPWYDPRANVVRVVRWAWRCSGGSLFERKETMAQLMASEARSPERGDSCTDAGKSAARARIPRFRKAGNMQRMGRD